MSQGAEAKIDPNQSKQPFRQDLSLRLTQGNKPRHLSLGSIQVLMNSHGVHQFTQFWHY